MSRAFAKKLLKIPKNRKKLANLTRERCRGCKNKEISKSVLTNERLCDKILPEPNQANTKKRFLTAKIRGGIPC
jgi:hypothetical protein